MRRPHALSAAAFASPRAETKLARHPTPTFDHAPVTISQKIHGHDVNDGGRGEMSCGCGGRLYGAYLRRRSDVKSHASVERESPPAAAAAVARARAEG